MIWVWLAVLAAGFQTLRFLLQKKLSMQGLSAAGATWARFVYGAPFVVALALGYGLARGLAPGLPGGRFWAFAMAGGLAQILGTWAMVALFANRNFAVGITLKKTEVLQAALAGFVLLGDRVGAGALAAMALGFAGVALLGRRGGAGGGAGAGIGAGVGAGVGLGLLAGALFALSAVGYRGAVLAAGSGDRFMDAVFTLAVVSLAQTLAVALWLARWQPGQVGAVLAAWRRALWIGLAGVAGSVAWFAAFRLASAGLVFAVGQVEVIFSVLAGWLVFGERLSRREVAGIALITLSVLLLVASAGQAAAGQNVIERAGAAQPHEQAVFAGVEEKRHLVGG